MKSALDCAGPALQPGCTLGSLFSPPNNTCVQAVIAAFQCLTDLAGFTCSGLGEHVTGDVDGSCTAKATCGPGAPSMTCDAQGTCTCVADGTPVGTCKNLIGGTELCSVTASCCTPLFKK